MKISTELRNLVQAIDPADRTDEHPLMQRAADKLDLYENYIVQSIDAITWASNRIEELEAENLRIMRLLS